MEDVMIVSDGMLLCRERQRCSDGKEGNKE